MRHLLTCALGFAACLPAAAAAPDEVQRGRTVFQAKCMSCHSVACNRLGPKLQGVVGRQAAAVPDFKGYSDALRTSGIVWDDKSLDAFLRDPAKFVPGNAMAGITQPIPDARDRRALVALMRREDRSADLC